MPEQSKECFCFYSLHIVVSLIPLGCIRRVEAIAPGSVTALQEVPAPDLAREEVAPATSAPPRRVPQLPTRPTRPQSPSTEAPTRRPQLTSRFTPQRPVTISSYHVHRIRWHMFS